MKVTTKGVGMKSTLSLAGFTGMSRVALQLLHDCLRKNWNTGKE